MTVALCLLASILPVCDRGGEAIGPDRGGHATPPPVLVRTLARFRAWVCIHEHEAAWNDAGDPYWGGLQMDRTFMLSYGRDMVRKHGGWADTWTPAEQIIVAERAYKSGRGFGPWPNTRKPCGV